MGSCARTPASTSRTSGVATSRRCFPTMPTPPRPPSATASGIGSAGIEALLDLRGEPDAAGRPMRATIIAIADELASAADLAGGKVDGRPVVVVRGYRWRASEL